MNKEPAVFTPENFLIDVNNNEELIYIAAKYGCTTADVVLAVETIKTPLRTEVYQWLSENL